MSQEADLTIVFEGLVSLVEALRDTSYECTRTKTLVTEDGKTHAVDLVVADQKAGAKVGIKLDPKTGASTFIAHDCKAGGKHAATKGAALAGRIQQRYAYVRAVEDLRKKGYKIAKEQTRADGSLEVVLERWK